MSGIYLVNKKSGSIARLPTPSDSLLLFFYVAAQFTIFPFSWLLAFLGSAVLHAVIDVFWLIRIWRRRYKRLPKDNVPPMVEEMARRLELSQTPRIFVETSRLDCSARIIPYMFGGAILMSSGLLMKTLSRDTRAEGIIAHELAHIQHGDYALFRFAALILLAPFANVFSLAGQPPEEWGFSFASVIVAAIVYFTFLRRRELFADARAMNAMMDRDAYLSYFKKESWKFDWSPSHPTSYERHQSLEVECVVSRFSGFVVFFGIVLSIGITAKTFAWTYLLWLAGAAGLIHILILLFAEFSKPGPDHVPMTYPEWRVAIESGSSPGYKSLDTTLEK